MNTMSNQPPDNLSRLVVAAREALTDSMVERLAMLAGNGLERLDRLNDRATWEAVHSMLDRITELHKGGAMDTVCDLALTPHAVRNALTDDMGV